jgi:predicted nucleotidyltransferase
MKKTEGLAIARKYKDAVCKRGYPVERMLLFGSVVRNEATEDSDIDVAVVCAAFMPSRLDETLALWRARRTVDVRIEPLCLHPEDFADPLSIAQEIERTGIEV